jgi:hypothetical protein
MPGCRTKRQREKVHNQQFWLGQLADFVEPKVRQNRRGGAFTINRAENREKRALKAKWVTSWFA